MDGAQGGFFADSDHACVRNTATQQCPLAPRQPRQSSVIQTTPSPSAAPRLSSSSHLEPLVLLLGGLLPGRPLAIDEALLRLLQLPHPHLQRLAVVGDGLAVVAVAAKLALRLRQLKLRQRLGRDCGAGAGRGGSWVSGRATRAAAAPQRAAA